MYGFYSLKIAGKCCIYVQFIRASHEVLFRKLAQNQVDVLPSKNQAMYCNSINDITSKSHEQRLITKEHIAMHTHLIIWLCTPVL